MTLQGCWIPPEYPVRRMPNPERIPWGKDAAGIWILGGPKEKQPCSTWLCPGQQGLHGQAQPRGLSPLGCWRLLEGNSPAHPLNPAWEQGESPASIIPARSRQIPRGNGYFWASPRAIKSPVGAGTAAPQQEAMLPNPSRHKHSE